MRLRDGNSGRVRVDVRHYGVRGNRRGSRAGYKAEGWQRSGLLLVFCAEAEEGGGIGVLGIRMTYR
jgi:hypothetical protein